MFGIFSSRILKKRFSYRFKGSLLVEYKYFINQYRIISTFEFVARLVTGQSPSRSRRSPAAPGQCVCHESSCHPICATGVLYVQESGVGCLFGSCWSPLLWRWLCCTRRCARPQLIDLEAPPVQAGPVCCLAQWCATWKLEAGGLWR